MAVHSVGLVFFPLPWEMMSVLVSSSRVSAKHGLQVNSSQTQGSKRVCLPVSL